jgi:hypothetical protein
VLRALLALHALVAVGQPLLIGAYLDGAFGMLSGHRSDGLLLPVLAVLAAVAGAAYATVGRGRWHPVAACLTIALLEGVQIGMGFARILVVHIPLGILIVVGAVRLAIWSWTARAGRPRDAASLPAAPEPVEQVAP